MAAAHALRVQTAPLSGLLLLALVAALVSLVLLLRAAFRPEPTAARPGTTPEHWLVLDGSNVMHWKDDTPQIATLREVLAVLQARGFGTGVIFDANAGYKLGGRYQDDAQLARLLGLPVDQVLVVPKGVQADPYLLQTARDMGARVISQDRLRDRAEDFPEVLRPGFVIRGGYRDGQLWFDKTLTALAEGGDTPIP